MSPACHPERSEGSRELDELEQHLTTAGQYRRGLGFFAYLFSHLDADALAYLADMAFSYRRDPERWE